MVHTACFNQADDTTVWCHCSTDYNGFNAALIWGHKTRCAAAAVWTDTDCQERGIETTPEVTAVRVGVAGGGDAAATITRLIDERRDDRVPSNQSMTANSDSNTSTPIKAIVRSTASDESS